MADRKMELAPAGASAVGVLLLLLPLLLDVAVS